MSTGKTKSKTGEAALPRIFTVRKLKVVLDAELARLYGVPTKRLNEAIARNTGRFPSEFCFYVTREQVANLKSQFATSSAGDGGVPRTQFAPLENEHGGARKLPRVFTEHGALMAATILRSEKAVQMSLYLIRAFVEMRETLLANATILKRLAEIDRRLVEQDSVLREIVEWLQPLLDAPPADDADEKPKIGYHRGNR